MINSTNSWISNDRKMLSCMYIFDRRDQINKDYETQLE